MGLINVLDLSVANLIAAGEVVDRPSSAVKEMMENSIDAGATSITVEINRGGISFMRVADNGCGMTREDVCKCVLRHATSKIHTANDLDGIITLGFRGEALAAIAAISKLRIMTKTKFDKAGTLLSSEEGSEVTFSDIGCPDGTTIIAEELFANVPARRKFLKSDAAETASVGAIVEKIALSHPEIAIKFITDGNLRYSTSGDNKLINTIYSLFGRTFASALTPVQGIINGIDIYGYIGNPDNVRGNRNFQNFFINGRYVKSKTIASALEQAFDSYIPEDKFPCCVLNVKIHPALVDVNVHPAKLEVKFSNEKLIFDSVYTAVRTTLMEKIKRPEIDLESKYEREISNIRLNSAFIPMADNQKGSDLPYINRPKFDDSAEPYTQVSPSLKNAKDSLIQTEPKTFGVNTAKNDIQKESHQQIIPDSVKQSEPEIKEETPFFKILGEAFYSYIIVETDNCLLMIDKHAAHERIIFEDMKKRMDEARASSQILMMPLKTALTVEECAAAQEYKNEFLKFGFDFELVKKDSTVKLIQIPSDLSISDSPAIFQSMCSSLSSGQENVEISRQIMFEKAIYQTACKAALKSGRMYSGDDLKYIVDKLLRLDNIKYCPHGRPVAFEISKDWLENRFKRT